MKAERWQRINDLFQSAAERAPEERATFLDEACYGDENLRREVKSLIASYERAGNFIESPAFEVAPELLTSDRTGALVGELIGHYRIESLLGVGGMGEVYLARDELLGRKVALKLLPERLTTDETQLSRFKSEARTASALNHPNILTVYEIGTEDERHFIATEFIEGVTLRASLARGRMNLHDALEIAVQVASALAAAHGSGIVHRDIKPENIMQRHDGYVKVLDFGIAKLTEQQPVSGEHDTKKTSLVLGTARYMSPEQTRDESVDTRSDIWSLGVVLYEMVVGIPPFSGATTGDCVASILKTEPAPLWGVLADVPIRLQSIVRKALRKNPAERYQTTRELLADLRNLKRELEAKGASPHTEAHPVIRKIKRHKRGALFALAALMLAAAGFAYSFYFVAPAQPPTEKSIAVLPFEDLSKDKEDAYFADGVQDDVLTKLAKIGTLKVISRTSVMSYRGADNARQIGAALRVSYVLEGSVRRSGGRVRVNAQLIDTRTDMHVWADEYDRDLNDVFAIQSEIAQKIAEQLHAKMSAGERLAVEEPPTRDLVGYDLYVHARSLIDEFEYGVTSDRRQGSDLFQAVDLLNQAIARDPAFLLAYCRLAEAHDEIYFQNFDHTPSRLELANSAINSAFRLKLDSGEAHLARAVHLYHGYLDYDHARDELAVAVRSLPNDARLFEWSAYVDRRQGRWHDALRNFQRASELDPRNVRILTSAAVTYAMMRKYKESTDTLDRLIALEPNNIAHRVRRAWFNFHERGDPRPVHDLLENDLMDDPTSARGRFFLALYERDASAADRALAILGEDSLSARNIGGMEFSRRYAEALVARMKGDAAAARAAFTIARAQQQEAVGAKPDNGPILCVLGLIDAGLGRKEEALREGRRAIELAPVAKDSGNGADVLYFFAVICAWTGERDLAIEQLQTLAKLPASLSYGDLRLSPYWDPLRGDPHFEKIVASLAPKE
jgi:serine/threonine protein kinase/Flp pilus assembly protein TadD